MNRAHQPPPGRSQVTADEDVDPIEAYPHRPGRARMVAGLRNRAVTSTSTRAQRPPKEPR